MVRFAKLRKDEFVTRKGKVIRKPKDDRCNRGHLLYYDVERELWDCPRCIKMQQEIEQVSQDMGICPECQDMKMQGLMPGCCQQHLDDQMRIHDKYN